MLLLLWLWRGSAAVAPIRILAWEPPYAPGVALEKTRKKKKRKKEKKIAIIITATVIIQVHHF